MNRLKTTLLLSLPTFPMVFMGSALGGTTGMVFAFHMACAMSFFSHWFSGKIVHKMSGVRPEQKIARLAAMTCRGCNAYQ